MTRDFFMKTDRIGFSTWAPSDTAPAELVWGDPDVTRYICADERFSAEAIAHRLLTELVHSRRYRVQYWPIFHLKSEKFIGCCGLRPRKMKQFEIGFHLRPRF